MRTINAIQGVIAIGISTSIACAISPPKNAVNAPMVQLPPLPSPVSDAGSVTADPATAKSECAGLMQRGSFCDALREVRRAIMSDGEARSCLMGGSRRATSALPAITMACHAHQQWSKDCAGNPPGQNDVIVDCRFYIGDGDQLGYEYDDRNHNITDYLRDISAAVAACDAGYRASPLRSVGERDKAIQFTRLEPGSRLQEAVSICSELVTRLPNEPETREESSNPRYYIIMEVYGVTASAPSAEGA